MLDIAQLQPDLEAFARHVETDASIGAAAIVSSAHVLLARVGTCDPAASDPDEPGRWHAIEVSTESGERRVTCWCERPGGDASIEGVPTSADKPATDLTVQIGDRTWTIQGALLMQSEVARGAAVDPQDAAFFAELKQRGVGLLHATVRLDDSPIEAGRLEPSFAGGGEYEGLPAGRDPYAAPTSTPGRVPDLDQPVLPHGAPETRTVPGPATRAVPHGGPETLTAPVAAEWRCNACGQVNPKKARFCMNCAAPAARS